MTKTMKRLFGCVAVAGLVAAVPVVGAGAQVPPDRVTICHATGSETNPFVEITVSAASLVVGHGGAHEGDIIPEFTYRGDTFPALGDQSILANNCEVPEPPPS